MIGTTRKAPIEILTVNAGSSSIRFAIFEARADARLTSRFRGSIERVGHNPHFTLIDERQQILVDEPIGTQETGADALREALHRLEAVAQVQMSVAGHRIVHGGEQFTRPVLVDAPVREELGRLVRLDPLHQPLSLALMDAVGALYPALPQVACFDSAFHHDQPSVATAFALPASLTENGIRRYGFHGISYEYIAGALRSEVGAIGDGRVIVAHLGSGASMCAMRGRKSVATTMGFSPLDGLVMGTRCGALDPGVVLYLLEQGWDAKRLSRLLWSESGLLGVSGSSGDMRDLIASTDAMAQRAVDLFIYRIERELGSLAAAIGGLDALIFTAGIGENAPVVRARICDGATWLGVRLDPEANGTNARRISAPESAVLVGIIPTDEEAMIAEHSMRVLGA